MSKKNKRERLAENTILKIKRIFPQSKDIQIQTQLRGDGKFETKIELIAPQKKMVSVKSDDTYKKSIERSFKAVVRQIHKEKTQYKKKRVSPPNLYNIAS